MSERAVLKAAYWWACPECDREHFDRGVLAEMSEEDLANLRTFYGVDKWEAISEQHGGQWVSMPTHVRCEDCGGTFRTMDDADEFNPLDDGGDE